MIKENFENDCLKFENQWHPFYVLDGKQCSDCENDFCLDEGLEEINGYDICRILTKHYTDKLEKTLKHNSKMYERYDENGNFLGYYDYCCGIPRNNKIKQNEK